MDVAAFLSELCALPGVPGLEGRVAERVARAFGEYTQDVRLDKLGNVMGTVGRLIREVGMLVMGRRIRQGSRLSVFLFCRRVGVGRVGPLGESQGVEHGDMRVN